MWAVGVIMYMLLAGKPPFEGQRDEDVFEQILNRDPDVYEGVWEKVSRNGKVRRGRVTSRQHATSLGINSLLRGGKDW
jgi:calcium-dependent protein kinase